VTYNSHKLLGEPLAGQASRVTNTLVRAHNHADVMLFTSHQRNKLK